MAEQKCIHCGRIFLARSHQKQKYCGPNCYRAHQFGTDTWEKLTCLACGRTFQSRRRPDRPTTKYCSRACYHRSRNGKPMSADALEVKAQSLARGFEKLPPGPTTQAVLLLLDQIGIPWQREVPIGRWIADILCLAHHIVIEVDGRRHSQQWHKEHDARRDADLRRQGFVVIRILDCSNFRRPSEQRRWREQEGKLRCAFAG
jgi:hypothetical protein